MWRENPIFGAGVGVFYHRELTSGAPNPAVPHNTALWLLSETGIAGVAVVAGAGLFLFRHLMRALSAAGGAVRGHLLASCAILALHVGASVGMDCFYQRPLWLFAGIGVGALHMIRRNGEHAA